MLKNPEELSLIMSLTIEDFRKWSLDFKAVCKEKTGHDFPDDPWDQLWGAELLQFLIAGTLKCYLLSYAE
jgi:pyruvate,orthophosphate dikinase